MYALSLFLVFALAKSAALLGRSLPGSWWAPAAFLWQDAAVAILFAAFERFAPKRISAILFWLIAGYTAFNIPIMRAVSTPLTMSMLRAARGPLADSFRVYLTWTNAALVLATLALAFFSTRLSLAPAYRRFFCALVIALAALGPVASTHFDTFALGRNVLAALLPSGLPRMNIKSAVGDSRSSPYVSAAAEDLSSLRGLARGHNIIMVSLESTAAQYLRIYGGQYDVMPNLGALAENAVVFDNAYAVYPESIKGLYSVLCSAYPALDSDPESFEHLPCRSIAQVLADAGYRTALFHSGRFAYLGMESVVRNRGYQTLEDAGDIGGNHQSSFGVDEPATVARILSWIDCLPHGQPFYIIYLPIAGHHPYETPEPGPFPEPDDLGRYRNALRYSDTALGALRAGLRSRGLDNNTVWVIYGDHGEAFGQHEGNYAHTFFIYEENVHVPFLIAAPGAIPRSPSHVPSHVRKIVSLVDTAPTVLDLTGFPAPDHYQGRSVLDPAPRMALFFTDYSLRILGLRDGPWKMIYELGRQPQLFDLDHDPGEHTDIAAGHLDQAAWYEQIAEGWTSSVVAHALSVPRRRSADARQP